MGGILSACRRGMGCAESNLVHACHSVDEWRRHLDSVKDTQKLVVIDFAASWCGPCKFIEPHVERLAAKYTGVSFARIDVDELSDVAREYNVEAMPTFVLAKGGKEVDRVVGADKDELEKTIIKNMAAP